MDPPTPTLDAQGCSEAALTRGRTLASGNASPPWVHGPVEGAGTLWRARVPGEGRVRGEPRGEQLGRNRAPHPQPQETPAELYPGSEGQARLVPGGGRGLEETSASAPPSHLGLQGRGGSARKSRFEAEGRRLPAPYSARVREPRSETTGPLDRAPSGTVYKSRWLHS